jgi:quercetin dioxygenase-like cupin family protein
MKLIKYSDVTPTFYNGEKAKGVAARVVIGKSDGASNFCMRVFELAEGGNSARHSHEWEHEVFFHAGEGEVLGGGKWHKVKAGSVMFVPGNEEHQIRNTGAEQLVFVCLIPSKAPEL